MNSLDKREKDYALWDKVLEFERGFYKARADFLANSTDLIAVLQKALHDPSQRGAALRLLGILPVAERQKLFDDLVDIASVGHSDIDICREVILSLPRKWVVKNIEKSAEHLLREGGHDDDAYEEYRRLLELYSELDHDLTNRLAVRASQSKDKDIREAGEDFLQLLSNKE